MKLFKAKIRIGIELLVLVFMLVGCITNQPTDKTSPPDTQEPSITFTPVPTITPKPYDAIPKKEMVKFDSGSFSVRGYLKLPRGEGTFPVVIFVHGDGPINYDAYGTYLPLMELMLDLGYATFSWNKFISIDTSNVERMLAQRSQIILDAIEILKGRPEIDSEKIGLWGISQAGYVMPWVLSKTDEIAFMVAISCPAESSADQMAFLFAAQAVCGGFSEKEQKNAENYLAASFRAQTYDEYISAMNKLDAYPYFFESLSVSNFSIEKIFQEDWEPHDLNNYYFWNPIEVIEETIIPVLAFFGEKDTQVDPYQGAEAYQAALEKAGNQNFRVEVIPGVDHNLVISKTGCLNERNERAISEWLNYSPEYLSILREWLQALYP